MPWICLVSRILRKLQLIGEADECPPRCNEMFQEDGWTCGLWTARWVERSLRELRGEGRLRPASIKDAMVRGNEFIKKIKDAGIKPKAKAKPEAKAPAKPKVYKSVEPVFETLEQALKAALTCTKCLPTKHGTKGCRACMGECFEQIRQKGSKPAKPDEGGKPE